MTRLQVLRRRFAIAAAVLGAVGIVAVIIGTQNIQSVVEPWFVWPAVLVGAVLVVAALDALVIRSVLPTYHDRSGAGRTRFLVVLAVVMALLSVCVVAALVVAEVATSIAEYCVPMNWEGCLP